MGEHLKLLMTNLNLKVKILGSLTSLVLERMFRKLVVVLFHILIRDISFGMSAT